MYEKTENWKDHNIMAELELDSGFLAILLCYTFSTPGVFILFPNQENIIKFQLQDPYIDKLRGPWTSKTY